MLPLWCSELRELGIENRQREVEHELLRYDGLKNLKKLVKISFSQAELLKDNDVAEMLKNNPNIVDIHLSDCRNIDRRTVRTIVSHAPNVETLRLEHILLEREDAAYFGRMKNLKSLSLVNGWFVANCASYSTNYSGKHPVGTFASGLFRQHIFSCLQRPVGHRNNTIENN